MDLQINSCLSKFNRFFRKLMLVKYGVGNGVN